MIVHNHKKVLNGLQELKQIYKKKLPITYDTNIKNLYSNADILRTYEYPILFLNDLNAYCAILQIYLQDYIGSLESLLSLEKVLIAHRNECLTSTSDVDPAFAFDAYQFRFSPMTMNECNYNILLCNILLKRYTDAVKVANQLLINLKSHYIYWIIIIRYILYKALNKHDKGTSLPFIPIANKDMEALRKCGCKFNVEELMSKKNIRIEFSMIKDKFAESFDYITIVINDFTIVFFLCDFRK